MPLVSPRSDSTGASSADTCITLITVRAWPAYDRSDSVSHSKQAGYCVEAVLTLVMRLSTNHTALPTVWQVSGEPVSAELGANEQEEGRHQPSAIHSKSPGGRSHSQCDSQRLGPWLAHQNPKMCARTGVVLASRSVNTPSTKVSTASPFDRASSGKTASGRPSCLACATSSSSVLP